MLQNLSGSAFGEYQLLSPVGWGGMSVVYHGLHADPASSIYAPGNVTEVAVKIMATNKDDSLSFYRRFQREVKVASTLAHPHILPVCAYGIAHNNLYLVMPYIKSGTLEHRLKEQRVLPLNEVLQIAVQIGQALDYAHSRHIIHRDVKPHNIMIGERGQYYLADFGLVKIMDGATRLTMSGHIIGTPAYMSPEQANGEPVDHRSDVYSLGIVLYECLVGRLPYPFETQAQAIGQHLSAQAIAPTSINPHFPKEIERVLMRALQKDPAKRYESAVQLAAALNRAAAYCKPETRAKPLVTLEQVERSRTRTASQARTTVKHMPATKTLWGAVGLSLVLWLILAITVQTRLWNPEIVLGYIIQEVEAVQTTFKETLLFRPERVVLTHPIERRPPALPSRPVHANPVLPEEQGEREAGVSVAGNTDASASGAGIDGNTPQAIESPSNEGSAGSSGGSANQGNSNGSANGGSNGNANGGGTSGQGNGNGNANGSGNAGGTGSGSSDNGGGNSDQGNGSGNANGGENSGGNGQSTDTGNGNGSSNNGGSTDQGNGSGGENSGGNGNGQSTDTGNGNGSADNGGSTDQGNGSGNANSGGNGKP